MILESRSSIAGGTAATRPRGSPSVADDDPVKGDEPVELARQSLVQLGFSSATAAQPVERVTAHVGAPLELAGLIEEALRWYW